MELLSYIVLLFIMLVPLSWLLPERWQMWVLSLATVVFLALVSPVSLLLLGITTGLSYGLLHWVKNRGASVLVIILQAVALFTFFKMGWAKDLGFLESRVIPIGLSYFSFRQIHYALEFLKQKLPPHRFEQYFHYLFFLPTFLIGPINRFPNFQKDLVRRRWDANLASYGLERILYGYFKITVIGNFLLSNHLEALAMRLQRTHLWWGTYLEAVKYFLNSYFQFAGYSDIAIGLAALVGFRVMENFHYPFLARNVNDFWNRWHISLSAFAKDYLYMPFMSMTRMPLLAILLTMLAIGLWHEFTGRYIIWGLLHGLGVAVWHFFNRSQAGHRFNARGFWWSRPLSIILTFQYVVFTFVIIMRSNLAEGWEAMQVLLFLK